jgi:hypothetical protein
MPQCAPSTIIKYNSEIKIWQRLQGMKSKFQYSLWIKNPLNKKLKPAINIFECDRSSTVYPRNWRLVWHPLKGRGEDREEKEKGVWERPKVTFSLKCAI